MNAHLESGHGSAASRFARAPGEVGLSRRQAERIVELDRLCLACRGRARPFVFMNMAMTADGKIANANRRVASFGSARDQSHLYALRATADAVMCGARTADTGEVDLGVGAVHHRRLRLRNGLAESHLRVVVSGTGRLRLDTPMFAAAASPLLILTTAAAGRGRIEAMSRVANAVAVSPGRRVDWQAALAWLRRQWGVRRLLVEGGGELNAGLFGAGCVDELHLTICPWVFGGWMAPTIADGSGRRPLSEATTLRLERCRRIGAELFAVWRVPRWNVGKPPDHPASLAGATKTTNSPRRGR